MMVKRKLPASEVIAAEYNGGSTEEQIAQKYGATKQAVSLRLRKLGIARPAGRPGDTDEQKRIKELEKEVALLKSVLLRVLDFHQTPGDPAYWIAQRALPGLIPEKDTGPMFSDDVS